MLACTLRILPKRKNFRPRKVRVLTLGDNQRIFDDKEPWFCGGTCSHLYKL